MTSIRDFEKPRIIRMIMVFTDGSYNMKSGQTT